MTIDVDLAVYPIDLVLRTCHQFMSRCYVAPHATSSGHLAVEFVPRDDGESLRDLAGAFSNALLDSHMRAVIAEETRAIRELLVAQAFCEADLLDRADVDGDCG